MTATMHARGVCRCPSQAASRIEIAYSYRRVPLMPPPPPIFICLFSISSLSTNKPSRARNPTQLLLLSLLSIITHNMMPTNKPDAEADLHLPPGFRFHPTDEELVVHYLCRKVSYQCLPVPIIAEVDLYKYDPWQLPDKALFGQKEWYFFTPRDRKYPNGQRPNRMAGTGYWKATGADKPIRPTGCGKHIGIKKALVFYAGKAPQGLKTNWIMHEYRLASSNHPATKKGSLRLDEWVLCRIYNKKNICEKPAPQMQQVSSSSVAETMDSPAIDSAELESFGTQESDIENNEFSELGDLGRPAIHHPQQSSDRMVKTETDTMSSWWPSGESLKEGKDWFMDLGSLEDLPNPPSLAFGEMDGTLDLMMFPDYYGSGLFSPPSKPYQAGDLLHF